MPIKSVQVDTKELEKAFKLIAKKLPSATAATLNKTANNAKKNAIRNVAGAVNVPEKLLRTKFTAKGIKRGERHRLHRAKPSRLIASMFVYMRGIPVGRVAGKPPKRRSRGVKARGGRLYKGAFYSGNAQPHGFVFKRRNSTKSLMMPKIGVRDRLEKQYNYYLLGAEGIRFFKREWNKAAQKKLDKLK